MSGFDINTVTVSGNLTRDPEIRSTGSQTVCSLRIAHNERYKDQTTNEWSDRTSYFDVTIWGGLAEWMGNNLVKGQKVVCSGRLKWREWEDQAGNKRQAVDITANSVVPVVREGSGQRSAPSSGGGGSSFTPQSDVPANVDDFQPVAAGGGGGGGSQADDDIPF